MRRILLSITVMSILIGCSENKKVTHEIEVADTTVRVLTSPNIDEDIIKSNMEFFALARKLYFPISFSNDGASGYFYDSKEMHYPLLSVDSIIDESERKNIYEIVKKYYSEKLDVTQFFSNNLISNYRMYGLMCIYRKEFISKLVYYEAMTKDGTHINFLLMLNMDLHMEKNLNNVILAMNIGGEAGSEYYIRLSSDLKLDKQNNILINQTYQVEDAAKFLENTNRTITINTCSDCKGDSRALVTYQ